MREYTVTLREHEPNRYTVYSIKTEESVHDMPRTLDLLAVLLPEHKPTRRKHQHSDIVRFNVLTCIQSHPNGLGTGEIASLLDLACCSVYRALRELQAENLITKKVRRWVTV